MDPLCKTYRVIENITPIFFLKCKQRGIHSSRSRSNAIVIDGVKRAKIIQDEVRQGVLSLQEKGLKTPQLTAILIGDHYPSQIYIQRKTTAAAAVGISTKALHFHNNIEEADLRNIITSLNEDPNVHGILVQLPLPEHICERKISDVILPSKDVDGFTSVNMGRFVLGIDTFRPCTAMAVQDLIKSTGINTDGKQAVVCGRSKNVGFPISMILHCNAKGGLGMNATTTICHRFTSPSDLRALTKSADILVSATGVPKLITSSMVKPGACVIDVGITRAQDKQTKKVRLIGDVDFDGVSKVAGFITPVPGGVGPVTVAMLLKNTLRAAQQQFEFPLAEV